MSAVYQQIIKYIDARIKEDITIAEIANVMGYSANHIYKIFKVYSPYPVMDYVRRKKLYFAANEMYSGRKLYDIALDYGYETPAGFYKAFKTTFGCSPSAYKNKMKEGISMYIDNVKNIKELDAVLAFTKVIYPTMNFVREEGKYSRQFWIDEWNKSPTLMLYAKDDTQICGIALGWEDTGNYITIAADGIDPEHKNKGIHEALLVEIQKRAQRLGHKGLVLGIMEGQEEFYASMGYTGRTLIQSEKYNIDELLAFNEQYSNYEITGTNVYDGYVNQIWLNASLLDKGLKNRYEQEIGDCWVQVIISKEF